ncbi:T9SS type A sorting domain-containing protein [Chitinophagaceae bacterium MMS25-I14]
MNMFVRPRYIKAMLLAASCLFSVRQYAQSPTLPSFPGAEGAGSLTSGGRGTSSSPTTVFEVTNLLDNNSPGSLRYALTASATYRTVVFRVSGTIHLNSALKISKANTTIAGQTAPGGGICLADYPVSITANNVIVRYIRFRMGDKNQNLGMVNGSGNDDAFDGTGRNHIMIDHCTMSWGDDEAFTFYGGDSTTLQWNLISEPLNYSYHFETGDTDFEHHGFGGIWGGRHASFHHNLLAHCQGRSPRFDGSRNLSPNTAGQENAEFCNNVLYDWGSYNVNGGEGGNYNVINNYYKYGPSTSASAKYMVINPYKQTSSPVLPYGKYYLSGNYVDGSTTITNNNWRGANMNSGSLSDTAAAKVAASFTVSSLSLTLQNASDAYDSVLQHAGAVLPARDTLDLRIINDVINRTGRIIDVQGGYPHGTAYAQTVNAWPALDSIAAPADSDHDGMPDDWETARGLNPNDASDRNLYTVTGYNNLENYLDGLTSPLSVPTVNRTLSLTAYPNPANTEITVSCPVADLDAAVEVYNAAGAKQMDYAVKAGNKSITINTEQLATGVYLILYKSREMRTTLTFIKK